MAIMGPLITTGSVDETTQQILFDRLREHLLQRFMLVSHIIVDSIREKGFKSIDIENCRSSKCVNTILDFLDELEARYQTRFFFQLSIHQSGSETHFSLKQKTWSEEELQRDVERRKMLIIFCVVAWNMAFYVFALLPLASIYKLANPYWLALANALISLSLGILLYKKQRFEPLSSSEQQENPKEETV